MTVTVEYLSTEECCDLLQFEDLASGSFLDSFAHLEFPSPVEATGGGLEAVGERELWPDDRGAGGNGAPALLQQRLQCGE